MIARVWQARIDANRGAEYDEFAHQRSLPTFAAHDGFRGCSFLGQGADRVVLTLWDSLSDAEALENSARYQDTVAAILRTGFILGATPVILAPVEDPMCPECGGGD
jgi:heme-degrading monooxygenase HmoA